VSAVFVCCREDVLADDTHALVSFMFSQFTVLMLLMYMYVCIPYRWW